MVELRYLNLSHAWFYGRVPLNLGNLTNLLHFDLSYNMFNSALPKSLQNMTSLRFLYLSNNHFTSSIPLWFCNFQNLVILSLESNSFTGIEVGLSSIIRNNCHLRVFNLSDNGFLRGDVFGFHGNLSFGCNKYDLEVLDLGNTRFGAYKIPVWLGELKDLKFLNLKNSSLYGPIPDSFGNLSSIESLDVSKNMLSGAIPSSFGKLLNLKRLRLGDNKLGGIIDNSFGQLRSLEMLDISKNLFEGVVSEIHFVNLSHLFIVNMDGNNLLSLDVKSNWVPPFQLKFLSMRSCKGFGTELPRWFQTQRELVSLDLANTSILGAIPTWLEGPKLLSLDLSYNQITGSLPMSIIDQMPNLKVLYLSNNHINGSLPPSICKLKHLIALDLSNNRLSGEIPSCLSTLNLLLLDLWSNKFSGVFPTSSGNLSSLRQLYLGNNNLQGELPIALRNCKNLILLDLQGNQLSGSIPMWLGESLENLQILKLRDNMFNGTIPSSLFLLPYLQILELAHNKLAGFIPRNIDKFQAMIRRDMMKQQISEICIAVASNVKVCFERNFEQVFKSREYNYSFPGLNLMVNIDLSINNLVGTIPIEIVELKFLVGLNLSHNSLYGTIPEEIGRMSSLQSLDLSYNRLFGSLPVSMSNLNSLGVLMLSNNNFSGPIPREGHLLTFNEASSYDDNPYLCGDPLSIQCPSEKTVEPPTGIDNFDHQDWDKWDKMWFYIIIIVGYATGFMGVLILKRSWRNVYFQFVDEIKDNAHEAMARLKRRIRGNSLES